MHSSKEKSKYRTIGEVARILKLIDKKKGTLSTHTIRFGKKNLSKSNLRFFQEIEDIMMKIQ